MKTPDETPDGYSSPFLKKVRALEAEDDRDQISLMYKRQEESCKIETDHEIPLSNHEQKEDMNSIKLSHLLDFQSEITHSHKIIAQQNITKSTSRNLSTNSKNQLDDSNKKVSETHDEQEIEVNQKNYEDNDSSQFIGSNNNYHNQRKSMKINRGRESGSFQMISSQQVIKNGATQNTGNTGNAQKELMNRFLMLYQRQKNQVTKLDSIVMLKIKLKAFFENYTYSGRARQIKNNPLIRKSINDRSDGLQLMNNYGIFGKFEWLSLRFTKCILQQSVKFKIIVRILSFFLGLLKRFITFSQGQISSVEFFKPHHTPLLVFNIICIVLNTIFLYFLSILIVYDQDINLSNDIQYYYFMITFLIWVVEFFVRINTAEVFRTHYIQNRIEIFKSYFKSGFILDFIPLLALLVSIEKPVFRPLIFLKYFGLRKDIDKVEKKLLMRLSKHYYIQMINLAVNIFLIGHSIGLMYYWTARIELDYFNAGQTWLDTRIAVEGLWYKTYLQSLYWSFTLLTTGSNEVETWEEMFFTTFIMMFTGAIFAYIFNTIGNIIAEMNLAQEEKKRDINLINNYMRRKKISRELQHKANEDLEFFYQMSYKKKSEEEREVLSKITEELQNKMQLEYNKKIINKIKILTDNFSQSTLDELCMRVDEQFYSPNQVIIQQNSYCYESPSLIFIVSGSVEILEKQIRFKTEETQEKIDEIIENKDITNVVRQHKKGDIIGEVTFFNGQSMNISVRSQDFTTVLKIDRDLLLEIIHSNERDFQKFCEIRDKILLYQELKSLNVNCQLCRSSQHQIDQCPLSHFRTDNPFTLAKVNKSSDQERESGYERKRKTQYNAYQDMFLICNSVNRVIDQIQIDSHLEQIYSSLSNLTDNIEEEENVEEADEEEQKTQTYSKYKEGSMLGNQNINPNGSQLSATPQLDPNQGNVLYSFKSRRTSRDHSFLFQQEKNFLQNQLSYQMNPSNTYQQFDSYQMLANAGVNSNLDHSSAAPVEKSPSSQLQQYQLRVDDNYSNQPSYTSLKEPQSQPIFLRRRQEQALITQLKNFLKDPSQFVIKEESIKSHSQSRNRSQQPVKNMATPAAVAVENQYMQQQNQEKIKQLNAYWYFESQKDYLYYFSDGNMFSQLQKYNNLKKKFKEKNLNAVSTKGEAFSPYKKSKKSVRRIL